MVHFYERPEKFDSDGAVRTLEECLGRAVAVAHKLDDMSQDLCTDAVYLSRALSQARRPPRPPPRLAQNTRKNSAPRSRPLTPPPPAAVSALVSQERQPRWDEDEDPMITNK